MPDSRNPLNSASDSVREPRKTRPTRSDVLGVMPDDAARIQVVAKLRDSRFDADSFGTRPQARAIVADALVRLEDALELAAIDAGGSGRGQRRNTLTAQREAVAVVRRKLETEIR